MAHHFPENNAVLDDARTHNVVMDGRIWLHRTEGAYDVITLEPMPPTFAGSNSLYSLEFYELARSDLKPGGMLAQWLPLHLVSPYEAASIVRTFTRVFPDSLLWKHQSGTVIIIGRKANDEVDVPWLIHWPDEQINEQTLATIESGFLPGTVISTMSAAGRTITDDNQLLSCGYGRSAFILGNREEANWQWIHQIIKDSTIED